MKANVRNSVRLIGFLGDNPKITKFDNGRMVANFSIATNEVSTDRYGNAKSETHWHRLVAWGKEAEIAEKDLKKGTEIDLEGRLTNRSYEDKNHERRYITEVVVNSITILEKNAQPVN